MDNPLPGRRGPALRPPKGATLVIIAACCFFAGAVSNYAQALWQAFFRPSLGQPVALAVTPASAPRVPPPRPDRPRPNQPPPEPPPADPRLPEPHAVRARAAAIARDRAAILHECQTAAGGDWDRWQRDTAPYRAALKAKIDALKPLGDPAGTRPVEDRTEALAGRGDFPLFELGPAVHLNYLYDPATLDAFRRERPVVAAHRWLRQQGIDLIFVPVPKMTEVYADRFLDPCPADGVIAPHVRQTLLELLDEGVEVVDGLALFRTVRDADREYLYNTRDPHWAPRGMRVMAREIADRVARYRFGMRARYALPFINATVVPYDGDDYPVGLETDPAASALSAAQQALAQAARTTKSLEVTAADDVTGSPVMLIGNSFVRHFNEQLMRELNLRVSNSWSPGSTTEAFAGFLREPAVLDNCRVIVWVTTEQHLTRFAPMPKPVLAAATRP